ncbi:hypothetical protein GcC1_084027 [Golovinomyces cichoracearum]|uniref:Uncharacterized protein n=1 Tax=Golovinomyces cichoracearum TaxID=62708 RepID=A0A420IIZ2_9PEZI|nr:hypothetical protein GcC1_084027 [Golovinomyces cichoracearum]
MALGTSFGTACDYSQIREGRLEEPFQPLLCSAKRSHMFDLNHLLPLGLRDFLQGDSS